MQKPIVPIEIPAFDVNLTNVKFMYFDEKLRIVQPNWGTRQELRYKKSTSDTAHIIISLALYSINNGNQLKEKCD